MLVMLFIVKHKHTNTTPQRFLSRGPRCVIRFYCDMSHLEPSASAILHFFLKPFSCKVRLRLKREDENNSWCPAHLLPGKRRRGSRTLTSWFLDNAVTVSDESSRTNTSDLSGLCADGNVPRDLNAAGVKGRAGGGATGRATGDGRGDFSIAAGPGAVCCGGHGPHRRGLTGSSERRRRWKVSSTGCFQPRNEG